MIKSLLQKFIKNKQSDRYAFGLSYDHVRWCKEGRFMDIHGNEVPRKSNASFIPHKKFKFDPSRFEDVGNASGILLGNIIEGLKDLASYDFQNIAWFPDDLDICSSFSEDVDSVFEFGLEKSYTEGEIVFGKKADDAFKALKAACDAIGYKRDGWDLLNSPEMQSIRNMAVECLQLIRTYNGSESTIHLISNDVMKLGISFPDRDNL